MAGIPPEVPADLRDQLGKLQRQLKILLNNHQILLSRANQDPQDLTVVKQIEDVKRYLISFSNQQNVVLRKVRNFLSNLEEEKRRHTHHLEILGPPPPGPIVHKQKPRKKEKLRKSKDCWPSTRNSRSASPESGSEETEQVYLAYFIPGDTSYRGHLEDYAVECPSPPETEVDLYEEEVEEEITRVQDVSLELLDKEQFMLNIDLLTAEQHQKLHRQQEDRKRRKGQKRVASYIPEVADKKFRYQTFLQSSITSPPHLRRRMPPQVAPSLPKPVKALSFPLETRMGTRSKSPSIAKSQLDGACDLEDVMEAGEGINDRLEVRDSLLKRREELNKEMYELNAKQIMLRDIREVQKEKKAILLKEQAETMGKIRQLLQVIEQS